MAAVPYTDAIIAPSNYRPLSDVNTTIYAVYDEALMSESDFASLPYTLTEALVPIPQTLTPSEVTNLSSGGGGGGAGGSARPASGFVYPRGLA